MFKTLRVTLALLVPVAAGAEPSAPPSDSGCVNHYVRWVHDTTGQSVKIMSINRPVHFPGVLADHTATASSPEFESCFAWQSPNGHHFQYTCANAYVRIKTSTVGKLGQANHNLVAAIASKTSSGAMKFFDIESPSRQFSHNGIANSYVQHWMEYDLELERGRYYALVVFSEDFGDPVYTVAPAAWLEVAERRCELGTP